MPHPGSASFVTPLSLNLSKPNSFRLFFYSTNLSRKNVCAPFSFNRSLVVCSAKSQSRINSVPVKNNEVESGIVFDKAVGKRTDIKKIMRWRKWGT